MRRALLPYALLVTVLAGAIVAVLAAGRALDGLSTAAAPPRPPGAETGTASTLATLLAQIVVVVAAARACSALARRIGQPQVIGDIVAGILLGPSLFGRLAPELSARIFPAASLGNLKLLAEVGVLLFMFVVGLELDLHPLRGRAHSAVVVSHASILVPYLLGVLLSLALYRGFAPAGVRFVPFALFMGIAMSITAFPVLARILEERRLTKTPLGTTAITCAAVDDVTAWSLLALVVAIAKAEALASAARVVVLSCAFIAAMALVVRPLLARFLGPRARTAPTKAVLGTVLLVLIGSALATERIGIHALFGAFLAGVVMPRGEELRAGLVQRLEEVSAVLFLPLFFAFTGLRTDVGLLGGSGWLVCLAIVATATLGKLGGTWAAARATGMGARDAFALGALMNTRGLMELIVLNVGWELGILSRGIFAMLVVMALATTFATAPLLALAERPRPALDNV